MKSILLQNKFRFAIKCNVGLKLILIVFFIQSLTTEYLFSQQKDFQLDLHLLLSTCLKLMIHFIVLIGNITIGFRIKA